MAHVDNRVDAVDRLLIANLGIFCAFKFRVLVSQDPLFSHSCYLYLTVPLKLERKLPSGNRICTDREIREIKTYAKFC